MRIISGRLKGKSINFIKNSNTRPLKDKVKENIFNILAHSNLFLTRIKGSNVLDLYSGIGSFGLECISRGAVSVKFVEKNKEAFKILKGNISKLSIDNQARVIHDNAESFLKNGGIEHYNIFFFDPPFMDKSFIKNLSIIKDKKLFKKKHIIIIHRERKSKDNFENFIKILITKNYGRSKIIFGIFN